MEKLLPIRGDSYECKLTHAWVPAGGILYAAVLPEPALSAAPGGTALVAFCGMSYMFGEIAP